MGFAVANNVVLNHTHEKVDLALNRLHTLAHLGHDVHTSESISCG